MAQVRFLELVLQFWNFENCKSLFPHRWAINLHVLFIIDHLRLAFLHRFKRRVKPLNCWIYLLWIIVLIYPFTNVLQLCISFSCTSGYRSFYSPAMHNEIYVDEIHFASLHTLFVAMLGLLQTSDKLVSRQEKLLFTKNMHKISKQVYCYCSDSNKGITHYKLLNHGRRSYRGVLTVATPWSSKAKSWPYPLSLSLSTSPLALSLSLSTPSLPQCLS